MCGLKDMSESACGNRELRGSFRSRDVVGEVVEGELGSHSICPADAGRAFVR